ncbi:MAG: AEC family transporter [Prevotellaceae bacterium]|jgi:predicted permease|nr:AEC family transporter [Prevotellaceae bacterium]
MNNFFFSVQVVTPLILLMLGGYAGAYYKILSPVFLTEANKFVFRFALPFLLFRNVFSAIHHGDINGNLISASLITIIAMIVLSCLLVPLFVKRNGQRGSMIQAIYRSNFLIYGIPLGMSIYGEAAMRPISMVMAVSIPLYNMSAVLILAYFSENRTSRVFSWQSLVDVLRNPLIIGCAVGAVFGVFHLELPPFIDRPIADIAAIATPLALIVMGGQFRFRSLHKNIRMVVSASVFRLIIIPAVAMLIFIWIGFRGVELCALFCLFATPTAVVSYIMSENMGCDGELSAQIIVLTTAASCFTIFAFVFIMKTMGVL